MTSKRILDFLATERPEGPCLVVDLDIVRRNYQRLTKAFPATGIYYAVKANPAPQILKLLASLGCSFDTASVPEIEMALAAGATPDRISYGNTIKKERDIARAHTLGVSLFAVDCTEEVEKIARQAPGARVFCRVLTDGKGAEWPLSRKFGCDTEMAITVLEQAHGLGLDACGLSFHVGSQQCDLKAWDTAVGDARKVFAALGEKNINLSLLNLGGGFPARYLKDVPSTLAYAEAIQNALTRHFGNRLPATIIEPGRGMVGNAGVIKTEVVLIARKSDDDKTRWVYLDIGKFGGLAETMDEAIRYPIRTPRDGTATAPCVIAGPTCDSADVLYEKTPYPLPLSLEIGDALLIEATGAYTSTYASVAFNGFAPLPTYIVGREGNAARAA
ncbi:MAG: type III PLP-dependent enzyme [Alphaproteobacteria bacterium]|nr:type III PLP-dependent enzyme [Alphaproteobacteria bacterium]